MGKIVKAVATIGIAVAVAVALPPLGGFLATTLGVSAGVATAIAGVALSLAAGLAVKALGLTSVPKQIDAKATVAPRIFRQSISNSWIVYGRRRVGGLLVFYHPRKVGDVNYRYFVIACAGHRCQGNPTFMLNDEEVTVNGSGMVTSGDYANAAWLWFERGTDTDAANSTFVSETGGKWTAAHQGKGVAKMYAKFELTDDVISLGMPNITVIIDGKDDLYDYVADTADQYSNNAINVVYDFLQMEREEGGFGASADEIPDATWIAAQANVCDEDVALDAGGTEKRYELDAYIETGGAPSEILGQMVLNMAGKMTYSGGHFLVRPGYYVAQSHTLKEENIVGPLRVSPFDAFDQTVNQVFGSYISPADGYAGMPIPRKTLSPTPSDIRQEDVDLPMITSKTRGERILTIMVNRGSRTISVAWPCTIAELDVSALDTVGVDTLKYNLNNYAFSVEDWRMSSDYNLILELREEDANIYSWSTADEVPVSTPPSIDRAEVALLAAITDTADAIDDFGDDAKLTPLEKKEWIRFDAQLGGKNNIFSAQLTALGLATEAATLATARTTYLAYRDGLSPAWDDLSQSTDIVAATHTAAIQAWSDALQDAVEAVDITTYIQGTAPTNPKIGEFWVDTATSAYVLKRWNGVSWVDAATLGADWEDNIVNRPGVFKSPNLLPYDYHLTTEERPPPRGITNLNAAEGGHPIGTGVTNSLDADFDAYRINIDNSDNDAIAALGSSATDYNIKGLVAGRRYYIYIDMKYDGPTEDVYLRGRMKSATATNYDSGNLDTIVGDTTTNRGTGTYVFDCTESGDYQLQVWVRTVSGNNFESNAFFALMAHAVIEFDGDDTDLPGLGDLARATILATVEEYADETAAIVGPTQIEYNRTVGGAALKTGEIDKSIELKLIASNGGNVTADATFSIDTTPTGWTLTIDGSGSSRTFKATAAGANPGVAEIGVTYNGKDYGPFAIDLKFNDDPPTVTGGAGATDASLTSPGTNTSYVQMSDDLRVVIPSGGGTVTFAYNASYFNDTGSAGLQMEVRYGTAGSGTYGSTVSGSNSDGGLAFFGEPNSVNDSGSQGGLTVGAAYEFAVFGRRSNGSGSAGGSGTLGINSGAFSIDT